MSNTYFISDTHFGHRNILRYEPSRVTETAKWLIETNKPTETTVEDTINTINNALLIDFKEGVEFFTKQHDQMLIDKWNSVVKPEDVVWFLGDFGFGTKSYLKEICQKLNGHKKMIMGNHDNYSISFYYGIGFEFVLPRKINDTTPHLILKDYFILSHEPPAYIQPNTVYFNIYGHVHSSENYVTHTDHSQCVCVERQEFKPIRIPEFDNYGEENENTIQQSDN